MGWVLLSEAGKKLGEARADLRITSEEFDEVGAEIAGALDYYSPPSAPPRPRKVG